MNLPVISMQDVTIGYPGSTPFTNINFEIKENECWAFIGENSLLINAVMDAIAGKAIISKGKIDFHFFENDKNISSHSSPFHSVAFLSSGKNFRNLSGVDESYYQQRYNSQDAENSLTLEAHLSNLYHENNFSLWTLDKIIEVLHLHPLLKEHLIKLSNGETKRVRIAEALLQHPKILLLDHIFTGLDVQSREEIKSFINEISASGITVVMATPAAEIPECITHLAVFKTGNEIQTFTKKEFHVNTLPAIKKVNRERLETLLSVTPLPTYHTIVGMRNVSIKYDDKIILDNINWEIKQGERWALSGPNGAGKTTLLSLINGDNPQAFANDIVLFDRKKGSGESIWEIKKMIGFFSAELFQYFPLDTQCIHAIESGFFDTVGLFRPSHNYTASLALQWMELLGIESLSQKLLRNVSASERCLCLLARALVKSPPLLILDEPCQGFNEYEQLFFKDVIDTICELRNVTLIYVSHYREEIPESVTHFFKLEKGRRID